MRILFFLFFTGIVHCQESFKTVDGFLYDTDSKLFEIISNDSIHSFNLEKKLVKKRKISFNDYNPKVLKTVISDSFKFSSLNETNIAVDKKFNQTTSKDFFINNGFLAYNDTLFRIGGYGFWTKYRGISFFDPSELTWHAYQLKFIDQKYQGILSPKLFSSEKDEYLIFAGVVFDDRNPLYEYDNKNVFKVDFNAKQITYEGQSTIVLNGRQVFTNDNVLIIIDKAEIKKLIWKDNLIEKYKSSWTPKIDKSFNIFFVNDKFYYINNNKGIYRLLSSKFNFEKQNLFFTDKIIKSKTSKLPFILLIATFLVILMYVKLKNFNGIVISKNYLKYKFSKIGINETEFKIIKVLSVNQKITTNQIHNLLNTKDLHPNHIYRLIPEVMRDLSKSLNLLTSKNKTVFSITKNKTDRRIKEYVLNDEYKLRRDRRI